MCHNDLVYNWNNVLVKRDSIAIQAILDWETASAGAGIVLELGPALFSLFRHKTIQGFETEFLSAFVDGYGISWQEYMSVHSRHVDSVGLIYAAHALTSRTERGDFRELRRFVKGLLGDQTS